VNAPNLEIKRRGRAWWVTGIEVAGDDLGMGPYDTKAEAVDDRRGVERFYRTEARRKPRTRTLQQ